MIKELKSLKKLINIAGIYGLGSLLAGLLYRTLTQIHKFEGETTLAVTHSHLMAMGAFLFLILALFALHTNLVTLPAFRKFLWGYNLSFPLMIAVMLFKGYAQVSGMVFDKKMNAIVTGISGVSHIGITIALIFLFIALKRMARQN